MTKSQRCSDAAKAPWHRVSIGAIGFWRESWRTFARTGQMNMFKNHVTHNLSAYLHGELSLEELLHIQSHLRDCPGCRNAFEEIRFGAGLASMLETVKAPESLWHGLQIARESRPVRP